MIIVWSYLSIGFIFALVLLFVSRIDRKKFGWIDIESFIVWILLWPLILYGYILNSKNPFD